MSKVLVLLLSLFAVSCGVVLAQAPNVMGGFAAQKAQLLADRSDLLYKIAAHRYKNVVDEYANGNATIHAVVDASRKLLDKGLQGDQGMQALEYELRMIKLDALVKKRIESGLATDEELKAVQSARLDSILKPLLDTERG